MIFICSELGFSFEHRTDLDQWISEIVCQQKNQLSEREVIESSWKFHIFDTGLKIRKITPLKSSPIKTEYLIKNAKKLMHQHFHLGFSYGKCKKDFAWIVSSPSPFPPTKNLNNIDISLDRMHKLCQKVRIHYISSDSKNSLEISNHVYKNNILKTDDLKGIISIVCKKSKPDWIGPVLWHLIPINLKSFPKLPHDNIFEQKGISQVKLMQTWINKIRVENKLTFIDFTNKSLQKASEFLSLSKSIIHNHHDMMKVKLYLKKQLVKPLGENRSSAISFRHLSWLMWFSPEHRDLLLHSKADSGGLHILHDKGYYFSVLLLAQTKNLNNKS